MDAIEGNEHVKATTSDDDLYMDSYERYAGECSIGDGLRWRLAKW